MKIYPLFCLYILLAGCSVQSFQYDMVKDLFELDRQPSKDSASPTPNWLIKWKGTNKNLYAVNSDNNVFFTDGEIVIHFDGWDIISVKGLNYEYNEIRINKAQNRYSYYLDDNLLKVFECDEWNKKNYSDYSVYERECSMGSESFLDSFQTNNENMLTALNFTIIPGEEDLEILLDE